MELVGEWITGSRLCIYLNRFLGFHLLSADLAESVTWSNHSTMRGLHGHPFSIFHRPQKFGCVYSGVSLDRDMLALLKVRYPEPDSSASFIPPHFREIFSALLIRLGVVDVTVITKSTFRFYFNILRQMCENVDPLIHQRVG